MCAFYYEELVKENCFKKKHFKMLTSYDNEEFLYPYIDESELCESLTEISLKSTQIFQKSYYSEKIEGANIYVPAWRMKEKVTHDSLQKLNLNLKIF